MSIRIYQKHGRTFYEVYLNELDNSGKRVQVRRRGFTSIPQAQKEEFKLRHDLANQREKPVPRTWEGWHQFCVDRMKIEFRPSTIMEYDGRLRKWIHPHWTGREMHTISPSDVHDVIHNRVTCESTFSKRSVLKLVIRIFQMAVEEGIIDRNPAAKVKVKVAEKKQGVLNTTEVDALLREAKMTEHRFYPIWAMALLTGMRSGELYALQWSDVDFENSRISVNKSWSSKCGLGPTKSARNRIVPISKQLESLLKELKLKCPNDQTHVLPHPFEWKNGTQSDVLRDFCKAIGISSVKFHDLRATFITQLLLKGVPLAQVMAVVGHADLKTTNVYLRVAGADLQGVTDQLAYSLPSTTLAQIIDLKPKSV